MVHDQRQTLSPWTGSLAENHSGNNAKSWMQAGRSRIAQVRQKSNVMPDLIVLAWRQSSVPPCYLENCRGVLLGGKVCPFRGGGGPESTVAEPVGGRSGNVCVCTVPSILTGADMVVWQGGSIVAG